MSWPYQVPEDIEDEALLSSASSVDANVLPGARLRPSQFIGQVASQAGAALRASGLPFQVRTRGRLAQFWSGKDASIHFEVWVHEREARLEIGFHMEADEARNAALYRELDKCLLDIQVQLGGGVWLEPWDKGWVRLYETQPLWPLDTVRVDDTADRVVAFVQVIQPVYEAIIEHLDG